MENNISYKLCKRENLHNLISLYQSVFKKKIDAKELKWRFLKNPALNKTTLNYIAVSENGNLVGHTALIPVYLSYSGNTIKGALF